MIFASAATIEEALEAVAGGATPIAGGTDLVVGARQGKAPLPTSLVSIDRVSGMSDIAQASDGTRVGALVTHGTLMTDARVVGPYTALADAAALVGSPATRYVGTLGGNIMNASPAMDTGAPLVVFGALAELRCLSGARTVPVADLWTAPGATIARSDELLVAVHLEPRPSRSGSAYVRLEYRRTMEIAVVGAAASVVLEGDGTIATGRVALSAVAPTIIEVEGVAGMISGLAVEEAGSLVQEVASRQAVPISDLRGSARYRRHSVGVMARRALAAAARRASGELIGVPVNRAIGVGSGS